MTIELDIQRDQLKKYILKGTEYCETLDYIRPYYNDWRDSYKKNSYKKHKNNHNSDYIFIYI